MNKISVLVVEDNSADTILIKEYLSEREGVDYDISEEDTLESAIGLILNHDYDVILLDLYLPDSAGLDTVRRVISESPDIPVIVLTGLRDEEAAVQAVRYGAQDYLEKQALSPGLLFKSIAYAMERKRILQEKEDLLHDFTKALQMIENLEKILPICVSCRKISENEHTWLHLEEYIRQHADNQGGQVVCPSCMSELEETRQD